MNEKDPTFVIGAGYQPRLFSPNPPAASEARVLPATQVGLASLEILEGQRDAARRVLAAKDALNFAIAAATGKGVRVTTHLFSDEVEAGPFAGLECPRVGVSLAVDLLHDLSA